MDSVSGLVLFALFQATERLIGYAGGKIVESTMKPFWDALENQALWKSGQSETAIRWRAFCDAYEEAKRQYLNTEPNPQLKNWVVIALEKTDLNSQTMLDRIGEISSRLEIASLLTDKPDVQSIADALITSEDESFLPPRIELLDAISEFVTILRDRLFQQSVYTDLMLKGAEWNRIREVYFDTREHYLAQITEVHQNLEFVGIPELKDKQSILINDVFIHLQAQTDSYYPHQLDKIKRIKRRIQIQEALRNHSYLMILGDPGAGKTTLLKYVTLKIAYQQSDPKYRGKVTLPILIRLYDFVAKRATRQNDYSIIDYLYTYTHESLIVNVRPGYFENELRQGNCCVCLDGLDELGESVLRREINNLVIALVNRYPNNQYIMTSRLVGYDEAALDRRKFAHYTILPFSESEIEQFIGKWYLAREKDHQIAHQRANNLTETISREPRIQILATNPLMLTIIALVHRVEAELPHERVKLYDKCVTTLIETWDRVKGLDDKVRQRPHYRLRRRLLEQLAYWMHSQPELIGRVREIREGDLELYLGIFLVENPKLNLDNDYARDEARAFIKLMKTRSGLIVERGDKVYSFVHLTFQEYLVATDIVNRLAHDIDGIWCEIKPHLFDSHWREVILLLIGSLTRFEKHSTELIQNIVNTRDKFESTLHRHLFLAARILADKVDVDRLLYERILAELLDVIFYEPLSRNDALVAIKPLAIEETIISSLLQFMRAEGNDIQLRIDVARLIGQIGDVESILPILESIIYRTDIYKSLRCYAIEVLAEFVTDNRAKRLLYSLPKDSMDQIRVDAAEAIGRVGDVDISIQLILETVLNQILPRELRYYALQALGRQGHFDILDNLSASSEMQNTRPMRKWDRNEAWLKTAATKVMQQFASLYRENLPLNTLLEIAQKKRTIDNSHNERTLISDRISSVNDQTVLLLELALDSHIPQKLRNDAIYALGQFEVMNESVVDGLMSIVKDEKTPVEMRSSVAQILVTLGQTDDTTIMLLNIVQCLGVSNRTRGKILQAIATRDYGPLLVNILTDIANDSQKEGTLRCDSAKVIAQLGNRDQALELLLTFIVNSTFSDKDKSKAYFTLKTLLGA